MNPSATFPSDEGAIERHNRFRFCHSVSWAAIFAGLVGAMAFQVLFMLLGAGLGLAIYTPLNDSKPITDFGTGAMIIQGISAVVSLWFGGWIAGRFTPVGMRATGCLHGFVVWSAATVAGVLVVSAGAGWALGDLSKIVGGGLSLAGKPAAAAVGDAGDMAKDAARQSKASLTSFTDEAMAGRPEDATKSGGIRAKREIGMAVGRLFNPLQRENQQDNRAAVVKALVDNTGMSEADANKMVTDWVASYEQLQADLTAAKNDAEAKAREAANEASKALAIFSLCAFGAFVLGAAAAACGGRRGAKCATKYDGVAEIPA